jgi:hypothetical protein
MGSFLGALSGVDGRGVGEFGSAAFQMMSGGNGSTYPEIASLGSWLPGPQNTSQRKPPCPPVPEAPPGVSLDKNIKIAERYRPVGPVTAVDGALWFKSMVQGGGSTAEKVRAGKSWNYKKLGSQYEDFGNFNYGATGIAIGFDETTLLIKAGEAQIAAGTSKPEWGTPGGYIWGDPVPPYGDDPEDQKMIKRGIEYYRAKRAGCGS